MNILILNWRDIKNPKGGGAEVLTHEIAKRWIKLGHTVTQFSENFPDALTEEVIDGIKIIRQGSADIRSFGIPVHIAAIFWYLGQKKGTYDVVIDEIHGIPFFTPWYVREKKVALICEVADKIWNVAFSFPINTLGRIIEYNYFRFYKTIPFMTISPSTKTELINMGVKKEHVAVLPMGLSVLKQKRQYPKEKDPTLIFVGRLTRAKGIEDAIYVVSLLCKAHPKAILWVVGQGSVEYERKIEKCAIDLNIRDRVKFFGFIDQNKKFELMSRAHLLIVPSFKEGWGLTVPEAGFVGTPAIAYNVEGLRDVIRHQKTGILTDPNPESMTKGVMRLLKDKKLYKNIQIGARDLAKTYSWDETAKAAIQVMLP